MKRKIVVSLIAGMWTFSHMVACAKKNDAPAPAPSLMSRPQNNNNNNQQQMQQPLSRVDYSQRDYYELFGSFEDEAAFDQTKNFMDHIKELNNNRNYSFQVPEGTSFTPCVTGFHQFFGKDKRKELCEALKDDVINRNCSPAARKEKFTMKDLNGKEFCSGSWKRERNLRADDRVENRFQAVSKNLASEEVNLQQLKSEDARKAKFKSELTHILKIEDEKASEMAADLAKRDGAGIASFVALKEAFRFAKAPITNGEDTGLQLDDNQALDLAEKLSAKGRPVISVLFYEKAILYAMTDKYGLQFTKTYRESSICHPIFGIKAVKAVCIKPMGYVSAMNIDEAAEFANKVVDSANAEAYLKAHREIFNRAFRLDPMANLEGNRIYDDKNFESDRYNKNNVRVRALALDADFIAWEKAKDEADAAADSAAISAEYEAQHKQDRK